VARQGVLGEDSAWLERLELGRLAQLKEQLLKYDCAAGLFYDPINIRYATGTSNMQVYSLHNPAAMSLWRQKARRSCSNSVVANSWRPTTQRSMKSAWHRHNTTSPPVPV